MLLLLCLPLLTTPLSPTRGRVKFQVLASLEGGKLSFKLEFLGIN